MNVKELMAACPNLEVVVVGDKPAAAKAPMDALAVIDREMVRRAVDRAQLAKEIGSTLLPVAEKTVIECREARAVVAELVEAARPIVNVVHDAGLLADVLKGLRPHERPTFEASLRKLDAALAKFGGAK